MTRGSKPSYMFIAIAGIVPALGAKLKEGFKTTMLPITETPAVNDRSYCA